MRERFSWMAGAAALAAGLLSVGCGGYEPEPAYPPVGYSYEAPRPLTSEELAQQANLGTRTQANAESREILIGADPAEGQPTEYTETDPSALTEFKPALDGHGAWVDDGTYGTVWVPSKDEVGTDFQPYVSAGHWTYSEEADYVWVSDYSWGWAPFHYGRWVYLPGYGWSWIPGRRYAGAWVTWRVGPAGYGYVGWAPAPPDWYWYAGAPYAWHFGWYHHHEHYVYCPREYVYHGGVGTYVVRGPGAQEHFAHTHDYVPAPSRVIASPTVAGPERTIASPTVGGRIGAERRGPRPDEIGVKGETVVAPPSSHPGLDRARAVATVQPAGSRPSAFERGPATAAFVPGPSNGGRPVPSAPYHSPSESMTVSRPPQLGAGGGGSAPSGASSFDAPRTQSPSASAFRSSPSPSVNAARSAPTFRSSPSVSTAPSFRSAPSRSVDAIRSSPAPTFRPAAPTVSAAPSHSVSAIHSSPSAPTVHATPSGRGSTVVRSKK
jgi:hypothetical protein